ncbi:MAG: acylphosphatase [Candidatus Acidiferrales bacterium]
MPDGTRARRYYVSGMVQGVGYRYFVRHIAGRIGVSGYVKNLRDGRVEVYAEGSQEQLQAFRAELNRGPRAALVEGISVEEVANDPAYAAGFSIEHED